MTAIKHAVISNGAIEGETSIGTKEMGKLAQALAGYAKKEKERQGVKEMRILEGWTDKERKELEEAKGNNFNSAIDLISGIVDNDEECISLAGKYMDEGSDEDNQMAKDIADYYADVAKFPNKKYYVHFIKGYSQGYLNVHRVTGEVFISTRTGTDNAVFKTTFTKAEIENLNKDFLPFMEEVPEDELTDD